MCSPEENAAFHSWHKLFKHDFSSNFILCNKEGRSARTYGVIKQTRSRAEKRIARRSVFNSKKLNGDTHTSTRREREKERERSRERERERERDFSCG